MQDILFTPLRLNELEALIERSVERAFSKLKQQPPTLNAPESNYGDIDWYISIDPKKPAKPTVYSNLCLGKIPPRLVHKPQGSKKVLFHKDLTLEWINGGSLPEIEDHRNNPAMNRGK